MKNRIIKSSLILVWLLAAFSCEKDFLDTQPLDRIPSTATWNDGALSQAFVFNVYSFLGYGGFEEQMLASYTDEAMFTHTGRSINTFMEGSESPSNLAWRSATYNWDDMYKAIREANLAIENLPTAGFVDGRQIMTDLRDQLLGEAFFLRAYYYHQLLRFYGGVPLIEKTYGLNEDYTVARNSFEECVNFIVKDLDQAAVLLTGKGAVPGRASKLSALALKSRVLLYAASDLHDVSTASGVSSTIGSYSNKELLGYTSGTRVARWQAAQNAAKAVLDASSGYKLNLAAPVSPEEGKTNYIALSMGGKSNVADVSASVELIFQRTETPLYIKENDWPLGGIHFGINNGPNGYHNWSGNTPIQQLVDDYEMMDGSKFDWSDPAKTTDIYANRDPRLYATILYDGANWKPRPSDVADKDPANQIQSGYYDGGFDDKGKGIVINGIDTRESAVENWNGSRTHYWVRKFIDPDPAIVENQSGSQSIPWPFIRYTEVVLNYVEASIELGQDAEAITWLNKIRFRAGMPAVIETGDALRQRYRNERRIELVYEEHRYHDARRWMIAPATLGRGIKTVYVKGTLKPGATPLTPYKHDKSVYTYTYSPQNNTENETRTWVDKMYFRPMDRNEVNRNSKLIQNPGY